MDPSPEPAPQSAPESAPELAPKSAPKSAPQPGDDTSGAALVAKILGEKAEFSAAEVAAETGITFEEVRRLWRALGFPEADGARMYTRADIDAVSLLVSAVDGGLLDFDLAVTLTRALGQTMARLADWEASAMVHPIEEMLTGEPTPQTREQTAMLMFESLGESFEELMLYTWRRHLSAAVARIMANEGDDDPHTTELSVGFADIVSFTALSNELSRERIGDMVELFESRCADVVASQHGRVIKSIGDSILFVNDDPIRAYDTAEGIIKVIGRDPRMPDVRVGLASGAVIMRLGDVFGPPVNLAARLTNVARRNRVVIDAATAVLLPAADFETRPLPARPVRGFGVIEPLTVRRA